MPVPSVEHQVSEAGCVAGGGVETAEGFFVALFSVEQPIGIVLGLERPPQFLFGVVAQRFSGGGFEGEGQDLRLAAAVGELPTRLSRNVEFGNQAVEVVAVISFCGHGEERGVAFVPAQRGTHGEQVPQGDFFSAPFVICGQIFAHGVVEALYAAFAPRYAGEEAYDAFGGGEDVRGEGVAPVVAVVLKQNAVVLEDQKCRGLHSVEVGGFGGREAVVVVVGRRWPCPAAVGGVHDVFVEAVEVIDVGVEVQQGLAGVVGQAQVDDEKECRKGQDDF